MSRDLLILVDEAAEAVVPSDLVGFGWRAAGEWARGSSLIQGAVWPMTVVTAPRGAALYRPRSGQGREERSLDLMADP
jgi:hypothetical protein